MAAENTITTADMSKIQNVEFATRFQDSLSRLTEALGIANPVAQKPGTVLKMYKTVGTANTTDVAEGEDIPLSNYKRKAVDTAELTIHKRAKATTLEAIAKYGYEEAVAKTDDQFVKDIQAGILADFYGYLAKGTGKAEGANLQQTFAKAWGQLAVLHKDTVANPVYFVNPLDIADYVGTAAITDQTNFGASYLYAFTGVGPVVADVLVPQGTVYATSQENLNLFYVDPADFVGFDFVTVDPGYIGVKHTPFDANATLRTTAAYGYQLWAEYEDRIVVASIKPATTGA